MKVKVTQSCPTLCKPVDYTVHGILQARTLRCVAFPFFRGSSQPRSLPLQVVSLPVEPQGKPKNTGVSSLSLLQWIFLTQESNWGLLHCKDQYEIKLPTSHWIIEKARKFQKNIYFFIEYAKAFDCMDPNELWEMLKEMGIPDNLTYLLRKLYAGKEATVRAVMEQWTGSKLGKYTSRLYIVTLLI